MKKLIQVAIDSPAAAGAGTQAKFIARHYNLFYLDTGKIYRFIGSLKIKHSKKFSYSLKDKTLKGEKIFVNTNYNQPFSDKYFFKSSIILLNFFDKKIRKINILLFKLSSI